MRNINEHLVHGRVLDRNPQRQRCCPQRRLITIYSSCISEFGYARAETLSALFTHTCFLLNGRVGCRPPACNLKCSTPSPPGGPVPVTSVLRWIKDSRAPSSHVNALLHARNIHTDSARGGACPQHASTHIRRLMVARLNKRHSEDASGLPTPISRIIERSSCAALLSPTPLSSRCPWHLIRSTGTLSLGRHLSPELFSPSRCCIRFHRWRHSTAPQRYINLSRNCDASHAPVRCSDLPKAVIHPIKRSTAA
jgi:hypothetical protein